MYILCQYFVERRAARPLTSWSEGRAESIKECSTGGKGVGRMCDRTAGSVTIFLGLPTVPSLNKGFVTAQRFSRHERFRFATFESMHRRCTTDQSSRTSMATLSIVAIA
jgi:hypothetical protein